MIIYTMKGEVKLMKITDHQKLKCVRNFGATVIKEYFWGSREHALEIPVAQIPIPQIPVTQITVTKIHIFLVKKISKS